MLVNTYINVILSNVTVSVFSQTYNHYFELHLYNLSNLVYKEDRHPDQQVIALTTSYGGINCVYVLYTTCDWISSIYICTNTLIVSNDSHTCTLTRKILDS